MIKLKEAKKNRQSAKVFIWGCKECKGIFSENIEPCPYCEYLENQKQREYLNQSYGEEEES